MNWHQHGRRQQICHRRENQDSAAEPQSARDQTADKGYSAKNDETCKGKIGAFDEDFKKVIHGCSMEPSKLLHP